MCRTVSVMRRPDWDSVDDGAPASARRGKSSGIAVTRSAMPERTSTSTAPRCRWISTDGRRDVRGRAVAETQRADARDEGRSGDHRVRPHWLSLREQEGKLGAQLPGRRPVSVLARFSVLRSKNIDLWPSPSRRTAAKAYGLV